MSRKFFGTLAIGAVLAMSISAQANDNNRNLEPSLMIERYLSIEETEVRPVQEQTPLSAAEIFSMQDDCTQEVYEEGDLGPKSDLIGEIGNDLDAVIAIGKKIWKIIEDGKPVVNVTTPVVHALPRNVTCWMDLEHWQIPKSETYEIVYKNGFGVEVIRFRFRLVYSYGGQKAGSGQYLANVTIVPAEVSVSWGFSFNAEVNVGRTVNMGSKEDPMAGMQLMVKWNAKSIIKDSQKTENFFVQGDGVMKKL